MSDDTKNMKVGGDFKERGEGEGVMTFVKVKKIEKAPAPDEVFESSMTYSYEVIGNQQFNILKK